MGLSLKMQIAYIGVYVVGGGGRHVMLGLAWLGRDSSQHAGAAQIPPPRCRQGPRALGSPTRPLPAPAHPCAAPPCLEVSGGPGRLPRTSRHDFGCLEVSGGPGRLGRTSRHDLGCLEVSGGPGRLPRTSRHDLGRSGRYKLAPVGVTGMVKRCGFETYAQMPRHDLKDRYCEFGDGGFAWDLA